MVSVALSALKIDVVNLLYGSKPTKRAETALLNAGSAKLTADVAVFTFVAIVCNATNLIEVFEGL